MSLNNNVRWVIKQYDKLLVEELYALLQLRSEVFVVEQDCVYQDVDGKDQKAIHVMGFSDDRLVGYTRVFAAGDYFDRASIGRVVTSSKARGSGIGHSLMKESIKAVEGLSSGTDIEISAQSYLEKFYNSHGFKSFGEGYLEDGIPHIRMLKS